MAIKKHKNLQPEPADAGDAANSRSMPRNVGAWKLIHNAAYLAPEPQASENGRGSLRTQSKGEVNGDVDHSPKPVIVRRPYLKPAFHCDIVFSRRLMQAAATPAAT